MMKKKGFVLAIVSVALVALTGAAVAFAAWFGVWETAENTVKIGQPLEIEISGAAFAVNEILPGKDVSATFTIDLTGADFTKNTYALVMKGVNFTGEDYTYDNEGDVAVWTYEFNSEGAEDLTAAGGSFALEEGVLVEKKTSVTLTLTLDKDVPVSFAGGELTFILAIEETEKVSV